MGEPKAFAVGDKVAVTNRGDGVVTYGPITGRRHRGTQVVVRLDSGEEESFNTLNVWPFPPAPSYAVGDTVSTTYAERAKVAAGPFKQRGSGDPWWVVELPDGTHGAPSERSMALVAKGEASPMPQVWAVGDIYRDRDGDRVKVARTVYGTIVMVDVGDNNPVGGDPAPEDYANRYGPLTKIG